MVGVRFSFRFFCQLVDMTLWIYVKMQIQYSGRTADILPAGADYITANTSDIYKAHATHSGNSE